MRCGPVHAARERPQKYGHVMTMVMVMMMMMMMMMMTMTINQDWATKCALSNGPSVPYYRYEPQCVLKNSHYQLYCAKPITTYRSAHNHRPTNKTVQEAHSAAAAIPNSHNLRSTITKTLQKYTDLKEELITIWQL